MLLEILEEHFDEASALYERCNGARSDPANDQTLELRLRAHLDPLVAPSAPDEVWSQCEARLGAQDPGDAFVAAVVALAVPARRPALERALKHAQGDVLYALQFALRWHEA